MVFVFRALLAAADNRAHQISQIDLFQGRAAHLGINPAGVGNLAHQTINTAHIVRRNFGKLALQFRIVHARKRLNRAAKRGEGVLDLMRDISGKAVDRVDPLAQRAGHIGDRAGKLTDLVRTLGQTGHFDLTLAPLTHAHRGARQLAQRRHDGARQKQRKQRRGGQHQQHRNAERGTRGAHAFGDVDRVAHGQQSRAIKAHRRRRRDHGRAIAPIIKADLAHAFFARLHQFGPRIRILRFGFDIVGDRLCAHNRVNRGVEPTGKALVPCVVLDIREGEGGFFIKREAVRNQSALLVEHAHAHTLFLADLDDQRILPLARGSGQGLSGDLRLDTRQLETLVDELRSVAVEVEQPAAQQGQRQDVDDKDARGEREAARGARAFAASRKRRVFARCAASRAGGKRLRGDHGGRVGRSVHGCSDRGLIGA